MLPFLLTLTVVAISFSLLAGSRALDRLRRLRAASESRARELPVALGDDPAHALVRTSIERAEDEVAALRKRLEDLDRIENTLGTSGHQTERVQLWREIEREKFLVNVAHADHALERLFEVLAGLPADLQHSAMATAEHESAARSQSLRAELRGLERPDLVRQLRLRHDWLRALRRALASSGAKPYR